MLIAKILDGMIKTREKRVFIGTEKKLWSSDNIVLTNE